MIARTASGTRHPAIGLLPACITLWSLWFAFGPQQTSLWAGSSPDETGTPGAATAAQSRQAPQPTKATSSPQTRPMLSGQGTDVGIHFDPSARGGRSKRHRRHATRRRTRSRRRRPTPRTRRRAWKRRRAADVPYAGIVPGKMDRAPGIKPPAGCWLTWPGFQMTKTGSRIFLQFTRRPQFHMDVSHGSITMRFDRCRIFARNTRRRLITRYFATPVDQMSIRRKHRGIEVRIRLKAPMEIRPTWRKIDGAWYLFADFPSWRRGPDAFHSRKAARRRRPRRSARRAMIRIHRKPPRSEGTDHETPPEQ